MPGRRLRTSSDQQVEEMTNYVGCAVAWVIAGFGEAKNISDPCPARRLKAFKASHVWAAGGARAQARRSTGDVVGGLPPEKSRGLRGGPAQRQRTEVGRIHSELLSRMGRDWMTAAKNVGKWHRGVERGAEALDSAWRRADLRQSNVQRQHEVSEVVQ